MKTFTQKFIGLFLILHTIIFSINAQEDPCIFPTPFNGNTGANMTVMLTPGVFSSLPDLVESSYIVAVANSGLVVGSADVFGLTQNSMAIWGDDSSTPEVDGAITGELINYYTTPGQLLRILKFSDEFEIDIKNLSLKNILSLVIKNKLYKKNKNLIELTYYLIEIFFRNKVNIKNIEILNFYTLFLKD